MRPSHVSVIIPAHNAERFIGDAVASARDQVPAPLEIIVIDDGSTDRTVEAALGAAPCVVIRQPRQGPAAARNAGLARARGDVLAFLDADDRWLPGKLARQLEAVAQRPDAYFVTHQRWHLEPGTPRPIWMTPALAAAAHPAFFPSAMLMRREVFERVGSFDERLLPGEDSDWLARAADCGVPAVVVPETLLEKRIHTHNATHDIGGTRSGVLAALRRSLERKRQSNQ